MTPKPNLRIFDPENRPRSNLLLDLLGCPYPWLAAVVMFLLWLANLPKELP